MTQKEYIKENLMNDAKLLIALFTPLVGFIVAFYLLQNDVKYQAEKISSLENKHQIIETKISEMNNKFTELQITLAEMKRDLIFIREKVK